MTRPTPICRQLRSWLRANLVDNHFILGDTPVRGAAAKNLGRLRLRACNRLVD